MPVNITIIQVYAPTTTDSENEHDRFYEDLQQAINRVPRLSAMFVMGDFNAKIGECSNQLPTLGQYWLGERNEVGDTLYSFCVENNLTITNTLFKQPRRRYTWTAPDGKTRNQIDYIMVHNRWRTSIRNSRSYPGADCNSDHNLVAVTFQARFTRLKKEPEMEPGQQNWPVTR